MENPYLNKQIWTSLEIVADYSFDKPFHLYLKEVFRKNKNWGSKDRRNYKNNCYLILKEFGAFKEFIISSVPSLSNSSQQNFPDFLIDFKNFIHFVTSKSENAHVTEYSNSSDFQTENSNNSLSEKSNAFKPKSETEEYNRIKLIICEWFKELQAGRITWNAYAEYQIQDLDSNNSFFQISNHPKLRTKIDSQKTATLSPKIDINFIDQWFKKEASVFFLDKSTAESIEFEPNYPINERVERGEGIIQDRSSTLSIQYLVNWLTENSILTSEQQQQQDNLVFSVNEQSEPFLGWDCCSGAGGKSIAWHILLSKNFAVSTTKLNYNWICSDVRPQILDNLQKRFLQLGIKDPTTFTLDLGKSKLESTAIDTSAFGNLTNAQLIIADLPCSGSGTWRRTPEERLRFSDIEIYSQRQYQIIENIIRLKKESTKRYFIYYLTCSVFTQENEENIDKILLNYPNTCCLFQTYFGGNEENADYIFGALFEIKPV